jgi:glycyl-tRNA synthetase beta chain
MAEKGFTFSLMMLIERSLTLFGTKSVGQIKEIAEAVYRFLQNRMAHLLAEQGYSKDVIAAVTAVSVDNVPQVWQRVEALEKLKAEPDFEPLAVAFKRVVNIIRKDGGAEADESVQVNPELFEDACESELFEKYRKAEKEVLKALDEGDFEAALLEIASLKPQVDGFFDGVMVMTDQDAVRKNRLALLKAISDLFAEFADFSRLSA